MIEAGIPRKERDSMSFISLHFALMVMVLLFLFYTLPKRFQPLLLLIGSLYFYYCCSGTLLLLMAGTSLAAYLFGKYKMPPILFAPVLLLPLLLLKYSAFLLRFSLFSEGAGFFSSIGLPLGISFYTLQLIAYCTDTYYRKYEPEENFLKFLLYTSFFPQILQGPIPRYNQLGRTLFSRHTLTYENAAEGLIKILCGLFCKLMIADKAGIFVNTVFDTESYLLEEAFSGIHYLSAGILYSFQLYADFLSCVLLAQGVALLFGIRLSENFSAPYFADSIKDFWHRWHISLSTWLRDYVYFPHGGSRRGSFRACINLLLTFLVSGIWHGAGFKFIFWGLLHGFYQIFGKLTSKFRNRFFSFHGFSGKIRLIASRLFTFTLVMLAWIFFRANSLRDGLSATASIFTNLHLEKLFDGSLLTLGLSLPEFIVLFLSILLLLFADYKTLSGKNLTTRVMQFRPAAQFCFALLCLFLIAVFGTYGFGYDANAFIYGGF